MNLITYIRAGLARLRARANARDTHRQAVRVSNKALRMAQARRRNRQAHKAEVVL